MECCKLARQNCAVLSVAQDAFQTFIGLSDKGIEFDIMYLSN